MGDFSYLFIVGSGTALGIRCLSRSGTRWKYPWLKLAERQRALVSHIETTRICEQLQFSTRTIVSTMTQHL